MQRILITASIVFAAGCTAVIGDPLANPDGIQTPTHGSGGTGSSSIDSSASGSSSITGGSGTSAVATGASDMPCAVQTLVATKCQLCHGVNPPARLLSSADFRAPSRTNPSLTVGQEAVARLEATGAEHMPPSPFPAATVEEISALRDWVSGGAAATSCSTVTTTGPDPYDTPVICTSMTNWTGGNRESPLMHPGGTCITCHTNEREGPTLVIGGTVFPTPHEPDDCNGVSAAAGAVVVITDANGTEFSLDVNDAGNFFREALSFAYPYHAKVVYQGRERVMVEAQESGDCNKCHTVQGSDNAPGRIFLP